MEKEMVVVVVAAQDGGDEPVLGGIPFDSVRI